MRSPLDAELMVSELLGTWWGQRGGGRRAATVEQLVGEGLVDYAGEQRSPAALALLSGIACLGTVPAGGQGRAGGAGADRGRRAAAPAGPSTWAR